MVLYAFAHKTGEDTALRGRLSLGALATPESATSPTAREGFFPPVAALTRNVGTMEVVVPPFRAMVRGGAANQGQYIVVNTDPAVVVIPDNPGAAATRYIFVVVREPTYDGTGAALVEFTTALTTAGAPPSSMVVGQVAVPANASVSNGGLPNTGLALNPQYTAAAGGVVWGSLGGVAPDANNGFPSVLHGVQVYDTSSGKLWLGVGTGVPTWRALYDPTQGSDSPWANLTLEGGIVADTASSTPRYKRSGGKVTLEGRVKLSNGNNFGIGTISIGSLPVGFRATRELLIPCTTDVGVARFTTNSFGSVSIVNYSGAPSWMSIDGIDFVVA